MALVLRYRRRLLITAWQNTPKQVVRLLLRKLGYSEHHRFLLLSSGPHQNYVEIGRDFFRIAEAFSSQIRTK
jgi:hypothetical protein